MSFSEGATYAPTLGEPEFLKVLEKSVFLDKKPKAFLGTVTNLQEGQQLLEMHPLTIWN